MAKRPIVLAYAVTAYLAFVGAVAWSIAFLANLPAPTSIDGDGRASRPVAIAVDLALLTAFAAHHSVMARQSVKRRLIRLIPPAAERATFVLVASLLLGLLLWQWQPVEGTVWALDVAPARGLVWVAYAVGWTIAVAATFMIDHADFVGLRQAHAAGGDYREPPFRERLLYARVRHPVMLGLLIASWATPTMTAGHLLFAAAATGYITVGVQLEERDLRSRYGPVYSDYADRVPASVPRPATRGAAAPTTPA